MLPSVAEHSGAAAVVEVRRRRGQPWRCPVVYWRICDTATSDNSRYGGTIVSERPNIIKVKHSAALDVNDIGRLCLGL
jgi:hypothetical protein